MTNYDEDLSVYNGHLELDILIDRPVHDVWVQFLDLGSWITSHRVEPVSGVPGTLGSITRVAFKKAKELGMPPAHHHYCKVIKVVPDVQYVMKTYSEQGGSYGMQMLGYDDTRFEAKSGQTKLTFNLFAEVRADFVAKDPNAMNLETSREGMLGNLNNLKRILETRR